MSKKLYFIFDYLLIFLLVRKLTAQNLEGNSCFTSDYQRGECVNILRCPDSLALIQIPFKTPEILRTLRNSQCGVDGRYPKVCCALKTQLWTPTTAEVTSTTESFMSNFNKENTNYNIPVSQLPADCGRDISIRILGGERTSIDEFPWMALLEYDNIKDGKKSTLCSGVLISERYVLTAAHCINHEDLMDWRPARVIFGEYIRSTNPDCVADGYNSEICAPPTVTINIEEEIPHEGYRPVEQSRDRSHDIALVRLSSPVKFSDYIKPICLPKNGNLTQKLWVTGWGFTEYGTRSDIKLKLSLSLSDQQGCQTRYGKSSISLSNSQICAGGQPGKDSCRGDSGGPLMSVERAADGTGRWTAVGVVSFGPTPCGLPGWPGVYTKIADYTNWIIRRLRPEPKAYWK